MPEQTEGADPDLMAIQSFDAHERANLAEAEAMLDGFVMAPRSSWKWAELRDEYQRRGREIAQLRAELAAARTVPEGDVLRAGDRVVIYGGTERRDAVVKALGNATGPLVIVPMEPGSDDR